MPIPRLTLNGIPVSAKAGYPVHNYSPLGGGTTVRMHGGSAVKVRHWRKTAISISGSGAMNPGLDGLDYDQPLRLDCTSPMAASSIGTETVIKISGTPREDFAPWGLARIGNDWKRTGCVVADGFAELTPVPGAVQYQVLWYPSFMVFAEPPQHTRDETTGAVSWTLSAEEI